MTLPGWILRTRVRAFEHCSITAKITLSVALLVSVNNAMERVEYFISTRDRDSLLKVEATMADTRETLSGFTSIDAEDSASLTAGLQSFSSAINTLQVATNIMETETANMTMHHGRMRQVAMAIEQDIEQRREQFHRRAALNDARLNDIRDAHRVLESIRDGERTAIAILVRYMIGDDEADLAQARDACRAILPVLGMLDGVIEAPGWQEQMGLLARVVNDAEQSIGDLAGGGSADRVALTSDDLGAETGLLQNAANISKRFAERVASLEAQTLTFRLSPTDEAAGAVIKILEQLTRFARILPSAVVSEDSHSLHTVSDQIDGYGAAFERFRQAGQALHDAHDQVRQEAARTAALVAVMRRLAQGDLEVKLVGLRRGDEIGGMTRAVQVFQENAVRVRALEAEPEAEGKVRLRFSVEDSGIGMEPYQLETIFQPFEQVGDIRRRAGGAGLGLAVSRQLVRRMGGDIGVGTTPGVGSRFHFELTLPIAEFRQKNSEPEQNPVEYGAVPKKKDTAAPEWVWPPPQQVEVLHRLALMGDMRAIRRWADGLGAEDPQYRQLADRLIELANGFQSGAVLKLVEQHMERGLSV